MMPLETRLYTWVDVEHALYCITEAQPWPAWLVWARAYWDGLTLAIRPGSEARAKEWLSYTFEALYVSDPPEHFSGGSLRLESRPNHPRHLPVLLHETDELPPRPRLKPSLRRSSVLAPPFDHPDGPPPLPEGLPPVAALHAFKGGVGRTVHAIALCRSLAQQGRKVLLVDADLEAPGITWLLRSRFPVPPVAFADLISLLHGDPDPSGTESIQLVGDRLADVVDGGIFFLPAFRSPEQFHTLEIRPEHLVEGAVDPFLLTRALAELGQSLGVDLVLVDLRAGFSELAAGLLLDPRVHRILVTTLSSQSLQGTCETLRLLGAVAPSRRDEDPVPIAIVSQVSQERHFQILLEEAERSLHEAAQHLRRPVPGEDTTGAGSDLLDSPVLEVVSTPFSTALLALPDSWAEVVDQVNAVGIGDRLQDLHRRLPLRKQQSAVRSPNLAARRAGLAETARALVYAESGAGTAFLPTEALRNLASDHRNALPRVVVVGAKGAGKTYTFLQLARAELWETFLTQAGVVVSANGTPGSAISLFPLLEPLNLDPEAQRITSRAREQTIRTLGLSGGLAPDDLRDCIRDALLEKRHEGQWRQLWLDLFAWAVGFRTRESGAGAHLAEHLHRAGQRVIFLMDGLEDLFQSLTSNDLQQIDLRALLQEVPIRLVQDPVQSLGLLVYARRDMVLSAIQQNAGQFLSRYNSYALNWNREEALRLILWTTVRAGAVDEPAVSLSELDENQIVTLLDPLWGRKLGRDSSREARSIEWIFGALSDFRGQVQARDLMRLLAEAARENDPAQQWEDRVLLPRAIRAATRVCSTAKIDEIKTENRPLGTLLDRLSQMPTQQREIPFTREALGLLSEDVRLLESNGVILRDNDEYYMPEIYRLGLGFSLRSGARPRVLTLVRMAGAGG